MLVFECKLMTELHERNLNNQAKNLLIKDEILTKEDFMKIEFWFERDPNVNTKISKIIISYFLEERLPLYSKAM